MIATMIRGCTPSIASERLGRLLETIHGYGPHRTNVLVREARLIRIGILDKRISQLSVYEREALARALERRHGNW